MIPLFIVLVYSMKHLLWSSTECWHFAQLLITPACFSGPSWLTNIFSFQNNSLGWVGYGRQWTQDISLLQLSQPPHRQPTQLPIQRAHSPRGNENENHMRWYTSIRKAECTSKVWRYQVLISMWNSHTLRKFGCNYFGMKHKFLIKLS